MSDIIDRINQLVDDQLADGEPRTGYDYGDPQYPKCGHCDRAWHGLPVTERIAEMYLAGEFDEDYRVDSDDSRVLCEGSDFIGPMQHAPHGPSTYRGGRWETTQMAIDIVLRAMGNIYSPLTTTDWLNVQRGSRVSFIDNSGAMYTGTVGDIDENEQTGEINMSVDQYPSLGTRPGFQWLAVADAAGFYDIGALAGDIE